MKIRANLKLRNRAILDGMAAKELNVLSLAKKAGCCIQVIYRLINLDFTGDPEQLRARVDKVALILGIPPESIVPDELIGAAIQNKFQQDLKVDPNKLLGFQERTMKRLTHAVAEEHSVSPSTMRQDLVREAIALLPLTQREAIRLHYGIDGMEPLPATEIARIFRVTTQTICTRIHKAEHAIRKYVASRVPEDERTLEETEVVKRW